MYWLSNEPLLAHVEVMMIQQQEGRVEEELLILIWTSSSLSASVQGSLVSLQLAHFLTSSQHCKIKSN